MKKSRLLPAMAKARLENPPVDEEKERRQREEDERLRAKGHLIWRFTNGVVFDMDLSGASRTTKS